MHTVEQRLLVVSLVQQAHQLLDQFVEMDANDSQGAWEVVVELQALIDELRSIRPPRAFRQRR